MILKIQMQKISYYIRILYPFLLILFLVIIFWNGLNKLSYIYLCPILSTIRDDSMLVQVSFWTLVIIPYICNFQKLNREKIFLPNRLFILFFCIVLYLIFRLSGLYIFYGCIPGISYIEASFILAVVIECVLFCKKCKNKRRLNDVNYNVIPFYYDYPSDKDLLKRNSFAQELVKKLRCCNAKHEGSFTVLIDEMYGFGKSTFLKQVEQYASECSMDVVWFKPWLYSDNKKMSENLLNIIVSNSDHNTYALRSTLREYLNLIASIKDINLSHIHKFSAEEKFEEISMEMRKRESPLIILADDVDRLNQKELLNFLQLIRNTANFSQLCYIVAGDKQAMGRMLVNDGISNPSEYLKKFFNHEISFPKDDGYIKKVFEDELTNVLSNIGMSESNIFEARKFLNQIKALQAIIPTVRDVYRFLNTISYGLDILHRNKMLNEIVITDFIGLSLIKYAFPQFYKILRDYDNMILEFSHNKNRLVLISDFEQVLTTRKEQKEQKAMIESMGHEANIKVDALPDDVTYDDLISWLTPTSLEVMSEILKTLFPKYDTPKANSICYVTEFYKYFALDNKSTDVTNAEVVSIMSDINADSFRTHAGQIIHSNRKESFFHKLIWYIETQSYSRISTLKKLLTINSIVNTNEQRPKGWTEISYFQVNFYYPIQQIFATNNSRENNQQSYVELINWCKEDTNHKNVILALCALHEDFQYRNYVFSNDDFIESCNAAFNSFIDNAFSKRPYDGNNCEILALYKDNLSSFCSIMEAIIEIIHTFSKPETFLFYALLYENHKLVWNKPFIRTVLADFYQINNRKLFDVLIPSEWMIDLNINMLDSDPNQFVNDDKHPFINAALEWWKRQ